jgi:hypothetical protein
VSDVTVPFSATDNLSGFEPDGDLTTDLAPQTTSGEGSGLIVTSDGIYDMAGNFAAGINAGPFTVIKPGLFDESANALDLTNDNMKNLRVYYEILKDYRFVSVEPATPLTFYRYHPLIPTDMSAFNDIKLDIKAYDFIDNNIQPKESLSSYFRE